jgi:hypothetical protein
LNLNEQLIYKVSIVKLFKSTPDFFSEDYGNDLIAFSFDNIDSEEWLSKFRCILRDSIGNNYLPVYRMADGEYQFLWGIKFDLHHSNFLRYLISFLYRRTIEIYKGQSVNTSWGESYSSSEIIELRRKYISDLIFLLKRGILCAYLYENPKNVFVHYNQKFLEYFTDNMLNLNSNNFFPFHFPFFALSDLGWQDFIVDRKILIVTGNLSERQKSIQNNLIELGAIKTGFYEISANASMKDIVDRDMIADYMDYEIALVAAGIGSLNIISQMTWFRGPVIDVGAFLLSLQTKNFICHGGAAKYPVDFSK